MTHAVFQGLLLQLAQLTWKEDRDSTLWHVSEAFFLDISFQTQLKYVRLLCGVKYEANGSKKAKHARVITLRPELYRWLANREKGGGTHWAFSTSSRCLWKTPTACFCIHTYTSTQLQAYVRLPARIWRQTTFMHPKQYDIQPLWLSCAIIRDVVYANR